MRAISYTAARSNFASTMKKVCNVKRLLESIEQLESGKGMEKALVE